MTAPDVLAVVPARKGSQGLVDKNVRDLAGEPLIARTIRAARQCPVVGRVVVTSDDERVQTIAETLGAEFVHRPPALATAAARTEDAVRHLLKTIKPAFSDDGILALLQPTSPLRTSAHIADCVKKFVASPDCRSAISVTLEPHSPYKAFKLKDGMLAPLFDAHGLSAPRQSLPEVYRQNGAIYLIRCGDFLETGAFYLAPALPFIMATEDSVDVDTEADLRLAEFILFGRDR